jgi:hypothetical protein
MKKIEVDDVKPTEDENSPTLNYTTIFLRATSPLTITTVPDIAASNVAVLLMLSFAQRNPDKLGWTHEKAQANPRRKRIAAIPLPLSKSNASGISPVLSSPPSRVRSPDATRRTET